MEELGCGTAGHDPSCLCDVVITNPLPPLVECMRNYTQDVGMAAKVAELRGYCMPWTDDKILDFLCDVQLFWDEFHRRENPDTELLCGSLAEVPPIIWDSSLKAFENWGPIRQRFMYCMTTFDDPCVDILRHLRVDPKTFYQALTNDICQWEGLDWDVLDAFDKAFMTPILVLERLAEQFGITPEQVDGLRKYWGPRRERLVGSLNPARDYFQSLCEDMTLNNKQIIALVAERYGVTYHTSNVSVTRRRIRDRQSSTP